MTKRACLLLALAAAAGCRTRLYDLDAGTDGAGSPHDLSGPHDLAVPPDFAPPPDLTPPFFCRPIYVIDTQTQMLSGFVPELARFDDVGALRCPGVVPQSQPETMSIDLAGRAWVFFRNGSLFRVDLATAECQATAFDPTNLDPDQTDPASWQPLGSSFSLNQVGGPDETLYVVSNEPRLNAIDPTDLHFTPGPSLPSYGELTGTALAELWLFAPGANPTFIARVDKMNGATDERIDVPQITVRGNFAFAFWGGSFWLFHGDGQVVNGSRDTTVYRVDRQNGAFSTVLKNTGRHIVGAGVSGCAPLGLDH